MLREMLRKFQPNFWQYVKNIETKAKKWLSYKKNMYSKTSKS